MDFSFETVAFEVIGIQLKVTPVQWDSETRSGGKKVMKGQE